jgi:NAD(P)H-nitrite reductase large subunit
LRIQVGDHTLLGAVVMGNQALSQPLQDLINNQVDITPVRGRLLQPEAPIAGVIIQFWNKWKKTESS